MVWDQLAINKPHLVYLILGGFTSLFMLCSTVIKERLYIGEATVATLCGIIFGPHAAGLIDPGSWGNVDQITLEFSRIVLVVQCFAVGVELPRAYMERHWKSVAFLLIPVMTFGYLIVGLFIWALIPNLNFVDSLVIAACVTPTDPVLASSVVGKGKFAKRVPKHIRDVLSAESGCNDGMAFPFVYLGLYIIKYGSQGPGQVIYHWVCYTILYECVFGCIYGVAVGYAARRAIRWAHEKDLIDRESFLVFYFVLALFCAGSGSLLGMDDLLVGFACGVGFSNDGWFLEKTEESHVSNVIDLLINLAFFVYFGAIIPWEQYNAEHLLGLSAWRLVVLGLLIMLFRRIPVVVLLKPLIPDIKTWREAFFCGHFGPMGVGALFIAILARAELETDSTTPLAELPAEGFEHLNVIELIWPVVSFVVICSIVVHGSSIAVFTLGKHINTLTLTMSYTQGNDAGWMDRLPRIQSRSKTSSMSIDRGDDSESAFNEKLNLPAGVVPKNFLRRQKEEDTPDKLSSRRPAHRRKKSSNYGGPVSQSAFGPARSSSGADPALVRSDSDTLAMRSEDSPSSQYDKSDDSTPTEKPGKDDLEIYEEGGQTVYENKDGEVVEVEDEDPNMSDSKREDHELHEEKRLERARSMDKEGKSRKEHHHKEHESHDEEASTEPQREQATESPRPGGWRRGFSFASTTAAIREHGHRKAEKAPVEKRGAARAYQYGNTIIVEDEDGEVIKKYDINPPAPKKEGQQHHFTDPAKTRQRMNRMGSYLGVRAKEAPEAATASGSGSNAAEAPETKKNKKLQDLIGDDDRIRFTMGAGGRRLSKAEFIQQIQQLDPKSRARVVQSANVPEAAKAEAWADAKKHEAKQKKPSGRPQVKVQPPSPHLEASSSRSSTEGALVKQASHEGKPQGPEGLTLVNSNDQEIPLHNVAGDLENYTKQGSASQPTAAERRRREARDRAPEDEEDDSEDDGTERVPPRMRPRDKDPAKSDAEGETAAERRRREGALGISQADDSESDSDEVPRSAGVVAVDPPAEVRRRDAALSPTREVSEEDEREERVDESAGPASRPGIRFADNPAPQRDPSASAKRRPQRRFK